MFPKAALTLFSLLAVAYAQQAGTQTAETHPPLTWETCTGSGCTSNAASVVLDSNWRWVHTTSGYTNCYNGNTWDTSICPDATTCANACAVDGADYSGTYGITTSGNDLTLKFVTGTNVGSRVYLMAAGSQTEYEMFKLLNKEFTFDVDVSQLPCGLNGALYFSAMDADGGMARFPTNKAGAKFGTGYCDSQCPKDIKFIDGLANVEGWTGSANDTNAGTGSMGTCCDEMDVWEANSISSAFTPHPCSVTEQTSCTGDECGGDGDARLNGFCDPNGCDFNSFRMGDTTFYGPDMTVDTTKPFTVVTQFLTSDNTTTGTLSEIRRLYVQNGKVIANSKTNIPGMATFDSVSDDFCTAQMAATNNTNSFASHGGMAAMGSSFEKGVVLVMSVWDDHAVNMLWLDSDYPTNLPATQPGVARGTCATTSGAPTDVEANAGNIQVKFSNIKLGDIGTTYTGSAASGGAPPSSTVPVSSAPSSTTPAPQATQTKYGQCGGQGWTGPTVCASGSSCKSSGQYYSQCL